MNARCCKTQIATTQKKFKISCNKIPRKIKFWDNTINGF